MSGLRPFFITGSNVKIKVNGKTMAFCTDLTCNVQIITQTPKVLGKYEGSSVEPLGYSVSGSFNLIRYASGAVSAAQSNSGSAPNGTNDNGNGIGTWRDDLTLGAATDIQTNPADLSRASTFDIEVYQVISKGFTTTTTTTETTEITPGNGIISKVYTPITQSVRNIESTNLPVLKIRNARITQTSFSLSKRQAAQQRFEFVALYVDEDSFTADFSGLPTVMSPG